MGSVKRKITGEDKARKAQEEARRLAEQQKIANTNAAIMDSQGSYESMGGVTNAGGSSSTVGITKKRRNSGSSSSTLGL